MRKKKQMWNFSEFFFKKKKKKKQPKASPIVILKYSISQFPQFPCLLQHYADLGNHPN